MFAKEEEIIRYFNITLGSQSDFARRGTDRMLALALRMTDVRNRQAEATTGDRDPFISQPAQPNHRKNMFCQVGDEPDSISL